MFRICALTALLALHAAGPAASAPLAVIIGGQAVALGTDTVATGSVELTITDKNNRTVAKGKVVMRAAGNGSFVSADSFAEATGADIIIIKMKTITNVDGTMAISITKIRAIDIKKIALRTPVVITHSVEKTRRFGVLVPSGNVATVDFSAIAVGQNTFVDVLAAVLAVEDTLSEAAIQVIGASG